MPQKMFDIIVSSNKAVFNEVVYPSYNNTVINTSAEFPYIISEAFKANALWHRMARCFHGFLKFFNGFMNSFKSFYIFYCFKSADIGRLIRILHLDVAQFVMEIKRRFARIKGFTGFFIKEFFYLFPFFVRESISIFYINLKCNSLMAFKRDINEGFKYPFFKYNWNLNSHNIHLITSITQLTIGVKKAIAEPTRKNLRGCHTCPERSRGRHPRRLRWL